GRGSRHDRDHRPRTPAQHPRTDRAGASPRSRTPPHMVHLAPTPPIPSPKMPPGMARLRRHHHMITAGHSPNYSCRTSDCLPSGAKFNPRTMVMFFFVEALRGFFVTDSASETVSSPPLGAGGRAGIADVDWSSM